MQMTETKTSSNIDSYGYDKKTKKLNVKFRNGNTYQYEAIPQVTVDQLKTAQSAGSFLHKNVFRKDLNIKYKKLTPETKQG